MPLTLQIVESLAPDQGALTAAGKLRKPALWTGLSHDAATATIWGECQGSGANPYRVVADIDSHGYKCSCPSRKFPCKHNLALMWMYAEDASRFQPAPPADWVGDWLGRRRRGGGAPEREAGAAPAARIAVADASPAASAPADDAAARARNEAATLKRRQQTEDAVRAGLDDLQQWIGDQVRSGVAAFVDDAPARCRRIASRLVDAKAAALASRIDELPSRLLAQHAGVRLHAALHELGQLVVLMQAWRSAPADPDARAAVLQAPNRDAVLSDPSTRHVGGPWEVLGTEVETRRDGLVAQSTWLRHAGARDCFALLQDFFPASAGRRQAAFSAGQRVDGSISFHPGLDGLRGVLNATAAAAMPGEAGLPAHDPLAAHRRRLARLPWALQTPLALPAGRIARAADGRDWWLPVEGGHALPLRELPRDAAWRGMPVQGASVVWDGWQARLLAVDTPLGVAHVLA